MRINRIFEGVRSSKLTISDTLKSNNLHCRPRPVSKAVEQKCTQIQWVGGIIDWELMEQKRCNC